MLSPNSWCCLAVSAVLVACGGELTLPDTGSDGGGSPTGPGGASTPSVSAADDRYSTVEGGEHSLSIPAPGVLANDRVNGVEAAALEATVLDGPSHGRLELRADGSLDYTPDTDWFGTDRFSYRAKLGAAESAPAEAVLEVQAVNDAPLFTPGPDQQVEREEDEREVEHWAGDIVPGPPNEFDQQVSFVVEVVSGAKALEGTPEISSSGTLRYRPSHHDGTAVVQVTLRDDGGTANDGADTGSPHILTITVTH
jgi:hypothetical protein